MKTISTALKYTSMVSFLALLSFLNAPRSAAQSPLSLRQAVDRALESRASLRAEAERISIAQGIEKQSQLIENPTFQFENIRESEPAARPDLFA